jgi:nucleoside-diphosphate-sugar epimerase
MQDTRRGQLALAWQGLQLLGRAACRRDAPASTAYNVSTGRLVRNSEVVAAINAVVPGANITLPEGRNPDRPPDNYLDTTRLRADTGFRPEYDVERAVPDYVDWLRGHDR